MFRHIRFWVAALLASAALSLLAPSSSNAADGYWDGYWTWYDGYYVPYYNRMRRFGPVYRPYRSYTYRSPYRYYDRYYPYAAYPSYPVRSGLRGGPVYLEWR